MLIYTKTFNKECKVKAMLTAFKSKVIYSYEIVKKYHSAYLKYNFAL